VNHHSLSRAYSFVAARAFEVFRSLVLDQHPLIVEKPVTVVAEDYRPVTFLFTAHNISTQFFNIERKVFFFLN